LEADESHSTASALLNCATDSGALFVTSRFDQRAHAYDDQTRHAGMLYVLMVVIAVAFGGFLWQLYGTPDAPRIEAQPGPYRIEPSEETISAATIAPPLEEAAVSEPVAEAADTAVSEPHAVASGNYVVQLAALRSEDAAEQTWRRFSSRAPDLFEGAELNVERADLGARGVYYRVRAGYFADRDNASAFCERIRRMGEDCIVAAR
jgi:cell division septation protein DedD